MIIHEIFDVVKARAAERKVKDFVIGTGYTAVMLDDDSCGVAYTFRNEMGSRCNPLNYKGTIEGESALKFAEWALGTDMIKSVIGVATINALLSETADDSFEGNVFDFIDIREDDKVGMIGAFCPGLITRKLKSKDQLYIFERNMEGKAYPDWAADIILPQCDVALITSTTFINKTIDHMLALCKDVREVVIVGASMCFCPEVLKAHGATLLAGNKVTNPEKMLKIVSRGGGGCDIKAASKQINKLLR